MIYVIIIKIGFNRLILNRLSVFLYQHDKLMIYVESKERKEILA